LRENPWLQLQGRQHVCLSRIAQLDQRTAIPDQCLHSAEADVRPPRKKSGFDPKLKPSIPHRSALRCSLFLSRSTPCAWSYTNNAGEVTREMRVVAEAALHGHIGERQPVIAQLFLGQQDALLN